jgi:hypothetical protein
MPISSVLTAEPVDVLKTKRNLNSLEVEILGNLYLGNPQKPKNREGDVIVDGMCGEYKKVGLNGRTLDTSNTINQVRAIKCNFLVIYSTYHWSWFVVPAHVVVQLVKGKRRGQHTEIPYECATLSLKDVIDTEGVIEVDNTDAETKLLPAVRAAIISSSVKSNKKYIDCMEFLSKKIQSLKEDYEFIIDSIL